MSIAHTGIAVVESKWWPNSNVSVRALFDLVADLATDNPHRYHYEMASSEVALKEAIPRIARDPVCRYLCLAMHGSHEGLALMNGEVLKRVEIRNLLDRIRTTRGASLSGLHLATCEFGTHAVAEKLFSSQTKLVWVAGYTEEIDWIESSALDLLFFNCLVRLRRTKLTELQKIQRVADELNRYVGGLVRELGFGIYVRKQRTGGVKDLLAPARVSLLSC